MKLKPIHAGIIAALLVLFTFWLGGYDFNKRDGNAVMCLIITLALGVCGYLAAKDLIEP